MRRIVEESLSRPSSTPHYVEPDREAFLTRERDKLRACLIEPVEVRATPSAWAVTHADLAENSYDLVAVARSGSRWLLCDASTRQFFQASQSASGDTLSLIGFSSDDALAEWNG